MSIIVWIIFGFVIGLIARAIMPGNQSMGLVMTTLLGIAGSVAGGLIGAALSPSRTVDQFSPAGFIGSILGALLLMVIAGVVTRPPSRLHGPPLP